MAVQLNHTIVPVQDKKASANFLAEVLGLDPPKPFGPFMCLETANGVSLDYDDRESQNIITTLFLSLRKNLTPSSPGSQNADLRIGLTPGTSRRIESTTTDAASILRIPPVTTWRYSRDPTAADQVALRPIPVPRRI